MNTSAGLSKHEMSKTYQYRKVMKPLLERKRRARINKCLDDLKDLMGEFMQQQNGDLNVKLEKADILELTVKHLRKVKSQKNLRTNTTSNETESFRSGYVQAANEVSRCLASLPNVDIALGTKLMTHLGLRLNEIQHRATITKPLKICCNQGAYQNYTTPTTTPRMCSPVSSGYGSDSDSSRLSPALAQNGLLQTTENTSRSTVWRPW